MGPGSSPGRRQIRCAAVPKSPSRGCHSAQKSLNFGHAEISPQSRRQTRPRQSPCQSRPPSNPGKGDHVFLVDGSSYIFRAYHALPPLNRKSDGLQVNAVLGFCNMLWKLLRDMPEDDRPTHLAIIFDKSEDHVPQQALSRLQGAPAAGARRPDPAIRADPRGGARLRPALPRAGRLRGRRSDRDLCAAGRRARRDHHHRLLRQGSDAARDRQGHDVRHHEGPPHRHSRSDREIRRAAGEGGRGAGAGRRFHRQRAGRARHRRQDRRAIDRRIWRPRAVAVPRRRDQAAEAARGADRERREGADFAAAGAARRQGRSRSAARRARRARAGRPQADRLPQGDGVLHPHPPRRRIFADRPGRRGGRCRQQERRERFRSPPSGESRKATPKARRCSMRPPRPRAKGGTGRARRRQAGQGREPQGNADLARRGARRSRAKTAGRPQQVPDHPQRSTELKAWIARAYDAGTLRDRRQVELRRSDAGRHLRHCAGAGAERRLLCAARPPAIRRRRGPVRRRARARPDQGRRRAGSAEAAAGIIRAFSRSASTSSSTP